MTMMPAGDDPTRVGRFEIRQRLRGGTPRVYRAFDPKFDREVTLQIWPRSAEDATAEIDRLIRRNRASLDLRHPAILPVFEIGEADGCCYVVGAFFEGPRLAETLAGGPLPIRRAAVVALALADGLACAHERGFICGAIHPSDVVMAEVGSAAWMDFGVHADAPPQNPTYAAPERLGDPPGPADTASDQHGLGVLFYAMLTGDPPYTGDDEEVTAQILSTDRAPSPRRIRGDVPKDLDAICRQAIAPHPAERYRTCGQFADDLRRWLDGNPIAANSPGLTARLRRSPAPILVGLGLIALAIAAVGLGGLFWYRVQQTRYEMMARAEAEAARAEAMRAMAAHQQAEAVARKTTETTKVAETRRAEESKIRAGAEKDRDEARSKVRSLEAKLKADKEKAEEARRDVTEERDRFERTLYATNVAQSQRAWRDRDPARARALLDAGRPREKRPDLRDWEWFYLRRLFQPPQTFTYKPDDSRFAGAELRAADGTDLKRSVCTYTPDGNHLAIALVDDRIVVWDAVLGGAALTIEGTEGAICDVAYSPDGKLIASCGADKLARIWDATNGTSIRNLKAHSDAVLAVVFSPDGQRVATASADHTAILWATTGAKKFALKGHEAAVLAAAFSPDGQSLVTADAAGAVRLWDVKSGECKTTIAAHAGAVNAIAFCPDGQRFVTGGDDRLVKLWDAHSGQEQRVLSGPARAVRSVSVRPDGQRLAAAGDDLTVSQWDLTTGRSTSFPTGHTAPIHRIVYRPDGKQMATASVDGTLKLWDADRPTGQDDPGYQHTDAVNAIAISPDGRRLATAGQDKIVRLWDARSRELIRKLEGHTGPVRAVAFSKDGRVLATGGDDASARLWNVASGQVQRTISGHTGPILGVAISPDGQKVATCSKDGTARVRETATGQALFTLRGHNGAVVSVQFNPAGTRVLTTGADGTARSWESDSGREVVTIDDRVDPRQLAAASGIVRRDTASRPGTYPARAAYSPKRNRLAFSRRDGGLMLYDTATGLIDRLMEGHDGQVRCLAFSPDGHRLATGDGEGVVKIWDVRTGLEVLSLTAHEGAVTSVAFGPDGQFLYTSGIDHLVKAWDGSPLDGEARKEAKEKKDADDERP